MPSPRIHTPPAPRRRRRRRRAVTLRVEHLEERCLLSYRTLTGFGNNPYVPNAGQAGTNLVRVSPVAYADGISTPSLPNNPSARAISNILNDQTDPNNPSQDLNTPNSNSLSDFAYVWGQFLDHDLGLTPDPGASFPIPVDPSDPIGPDPLPFSRSQFDPRTGTSRSNPRQQVNVVTTFEDLSQVYGSDDAKASALRTHSLGHLKTSPGNLLPYNNSTYFTTPIDVANDSGFVPNGQLFATGDRRGNENIELTALQTLFVREHNHLADLLVAGNPGLSDETYYQEARKLNIAEEELITYNEFLPAILGPNALGYYTGYDPSVNPAIASEFSTVAFRFGHSLLSGTVGRQTNNGVDIADVNPNGAGVDLTLDFFNPTLVNPNGVTDPITGHTSSDIGPILKADADNTANDMDLLTISQIRNLLFVNYGLGQGGQDLIARDIQRARDHGLPDYNTIRAAYHLSRVTSYAQINPDPNVVAEFTAAYGRTPDGHDNVNAIDALEGAFAETHVRGANVGPLVYTVVLNQVLRLAVGDRYFVGNELFSQSEADYLNATTLARLIARDTPITNLQSNVFFFKASIGGSVYLDLDGDGNPRRPGEPGLSGYSVQLNDDNGNVVATAVTDGSGNYRFDEIHGLPGTGAFTLSLVVPDGQYQTSQDLGTIPISRGDISRSGLDFGVNYVSGAPPARGGSGHTGGSQQAVSRLSSPAAPFVQVAAAHTPASATGLTATGLLMLPPQGLSLDLGTPSTTAQEASSSADSGGLQQVVARLTSPTAPVGQLAPEQAQTPAATPASATDLTATGLHRLPSQGLSLDTGTPSTTAQEASSLGTVQGGALDDQGGDLLGKV